MRVRRWLVVGRSITNILAIQICSHRERCDGEKTNESFEACLSNCTKQVKYAICKYHRNLTGLKFTNKLISFLVDYPPPPHNVSVATDVVIDGDKILETTVSWNYIEGMPRRRVY